MKIRKEELNDKEQIFVVVEEAFKGVEHSDGSEQFLVDKLRESDSYINELSIVALEEDKIIAHVMFTILKISFEGKEYEMLSLAPVSVSPQFQNKGIGTEIIEYGLKVAKEIGYKSVFVLGDNKYYSRFGFKDTTIYNINSPFDVPSDYYMGLELEKGSLNMKGATIIYPKEFF
ncbi:MAG: GNAT family N-acetyltransferase [Clostridium sp.]|uniref:GNAT family N-acetyltransferase n=1 Tax=Clostridium sp. TaxID=1506 RepID=UPI003F375036